MLSGHMRWETVGALFVNDSAFAHQHTHRLAFHHPSVTCDEYFTETVMTVSGKQMLRLTYQCMVWEEANQALGGR